MVLAPRWCSHSNLYKAPSSKCLASAGSLASARSCPWCLPPRYLSQQASQELAWRWRSLPLACRSTRMYRHTCSALLLRYGLVLVFVRCAHAHAPQPLGGDLQPLAAQGSYRKRWRHGCLMSVGWHVGLRRGSWREIASGPF